MALRIYAHMCDTYSKWILYLVFNLIFNFLRSVIWWTKGISEIKRRSISSENYATSAHKMTILYKYRLELFIETRLSDYVLVHHSFVAPEYTMSDDVHLIQVTSTEAIFVELAPNAKGPSDYPFCAIGYNTFAKFIITMPLASFQRLADGMTRNHQKIIFLQNQTRCGSTLLTEVFKFTGQCVTFSEPHPINSACMLHYVHGTWDRTTMLAMLRCILRVECKPRSRNPTDILAYVFKITAPSMICTDLLQEAFPDSIQIFLYRDPVKVARSLRRVGEGLPSFWLLHNLPNIPGKCSAHLRLIGCCDRDFRDWSAKVSHDIEWGYRVAANCMRYYLRYRERGTVIHGIRYEQLLTYQHEMTEKMFDICGLPRSLVPKAVEAFKYDSQSSTPVSREHVDSVVAVAPQVSPAIYRALTEMCEELDVPRPDVWADGAYVLPGSIIP